MWFGWFSLNWSFYVFTYLPLSWDRILGLPHPPLACSKPSTFPTILFLNVVYFRSYSSARCLKRQGNGHEKANQTMVSRKGQETWLPDAEFRLSSRPVRQLLYMVPLHCSLCIGRVPLIQCLVSVCTGNLGLVWFVHLVLLWQWFGFTCHWFHHHGWLCTYCGSLCFVSSCLQLLLLELQFPLLLSLSVCFFFLLCSPSFPVLSQLLLLQFFSLFGSSDFLKSPLVGFSY